MGSVWDIYAERAYARGITKRETQRVREERYLTENMPDNLSHKSVIIYDAEHSYNIEQYDVENSHNEIEGVECRDVVIIDSDNLDEKFMYAKPGEDFSHGGLVYWEGNYWLIAERDANTEVYVRAKLLQCNHLLKWVGDDHKIYKQWCVFEDGTKYLTGEYEDRNFVITRGDSRVALSIGRNAITVRLGRENRFLIDDDDSPLKLAYLLTKPLKLGGSFMGHGILKFVLQEVVTTDYDNQELGIADYYRHFPKPGNDPAYEVNFDPDSRSDENGRQVWL